MTANVSLLEADIAATRQRLEIALEKLQDRLTVSGLVDEALASAGVPLFENRPDFVMGLLRRHPVPVLIAAAGLGWMFYQRSRRRPMPPLGDYPPGAGLDATLLSAAPNRAAETALYPAADPAIEFESHTQTRAGAGGERS